MKPKALIFFDLDGTLLNAKSDVDEEIIKVIQQLKNNNIVPFIATGRSNNEIKSILKKTAIHSTISLNGQNVTYEGKKIYSNFLSKEQVISIKEEAEKKQIPLSFYTDDWIRVTEQTKDVKQFYDFLNSPLPEREPEVHLAEEINMLTLITSNKQLDEFLKESYSDLSIFRTTQFNLDIVGKNVSKATGIDRLLSETGLDVVPTYAFGDGINDLEMLQHVDYAIAMGNAVSALKEQADYITSSNIEDGIIRGLKYYDLI